MRLCCGCLVIQIRRSGICVTYWRPRKGIPVFSDLMSAYEYSVMYYHWRREFREMQIYIQKLISVIETYEFTAYHWLGPLYTAAASSALGESTTGGAQIRKSIEALRAEGIVMFCPYHLSLFAEVAGQEGNLAEALAALDEALALSRETGEHLWDAEMHRLRGELVIEEGRAESAEMAYQQSLALARVQQTKSLELRVALSLCRLWHAEEKSQEAYELLFPIYDWFDEGFDTPDLKAAQMLLTALVV